MFYLPLSLFNFIALLNFFIPFSTILLFSLPNVFIPSSTIFIIFPPQCFYSPPSPPPPHLFYIFFHPQIHRPPIDPTSTPHRPHIDPTSTLDSTFFNTARWIVKLYTTTTTFFPSSKFLHAWKFLLQIGLTLFGTVRSQGLNKDKFKMATWSQTNYGWL